jgi:hypothetical protein
VELEEGGTGKEKNKVSILLGYKAVDKQGWEVKG